MELESLIENRLARHWADRAAAIVIDPELENWLWADSLHMAQSVGRSGDVSCLRAWLQTQGLLAGRMCEASRP